ncbi:MAG: hypothetical protein C0483_11340 [Pirellula sp.]|nr:hypothetical protein [Pirellula sp.]
MSNGNTLITELGPKPRLLEVDSAGKIKVEVAIKPETDNAHMQTRMARKLKNGNYLVPHLLAFKVKEYSPTGEVLQELSTDLPELGGCAAQNWPFTAIRLDNGNTLVALTHGNKIVEFDAQGKVAWVVSNDDLSGKLFSDPCGCQRITQRQHGDCQLWGSEGSQALRGHARQASRVEVRRAAWGPSFPSPHDERQADRRTTAAVDGQVRIAKNCFGKVVLRES